MLVETFIKNSEHILKLFGEDTQEINEKNCRFSLSSIFAAFGRAHLRAADWKQPDVAPSKVASADDNGLIKVGTTIIHTHLLPATPNWTESVFPSYPILTCRSISDLTSITDLRKTQIRRYLGKRGFRALKAHFFPSLLKVASNQHNMRGALNLEAAAFHDGYRSPSN